MNEIDSEADSQQVNGTAGQGNPIPVHKALANWIQPLVNALVDVEIDGVGRVRNPVRELP